MLQVLPLDCGTEADRSDANRYPRQLVGNTNDAEKMELVSSRPLNI